MYTQEEIIQKAKAIHGDKYNYDNYEFVGVAHKSEVACPVHGPFQISMHHHVNRKVGCSCCAKIKRAADKKMPQDEFIRRCAEKHNGKYDYSLVDYGGAQSRIKVVCPTHGVFEVLATSHQHSTGCLKCGRLPNGRRNKYSPKDYLKKVEEVHGGKYDYSLTDFKTCDHKIDIICKIHGVFTMAAGNHLGGRGCKSCAKHGFDDNKKGIIYVLYTEDIVKIGITNKRAEDRLKMVNKTSELQFKVAAEFSFEDGQIARDIETKILKEFRTMYRQPTIKFAGSTEAFYDVSWQETIARITSLLPINLTTTPPCDIILQ